MPGDPPILLAAARGLASRGEDAAAKRAYLDVLRADATSLEALLELARLAQRSGHRSAAATAYRQAIFCHPADPTARVNLGNLLIETGEFAEARELFGEALGLRPDFAPAHQGLARVLTALGETAAADPHWRAAFAEGALAPQPYAGPGAGVPLLLIVSSGGGNIPTRALVDDTVFAATALYAEHHDPAAPLPAHALIFNAIGDADRCAEGLAKAAAIVASSAAPVVNPPTRVAATTRAAIARRLRGLAGLVVPDVREVRRSELIADAALSYPRLVRAPGFHTGQHFVRLERRDDLLAAIATLPGDDLLVIEPLDARGPDGLFRKYRVMMIGGRLYPLHLAASRDWKVHYFSADMADNIAARAEEARFLTDMPAVLGPRAIAALEAVAARLDLDYAGIDFGLSAAGEVLLFEANPGMVIQPPGPEPIWDYRRAPIGRVLDAVKALLLAKASVRDSQ